MRATGRGYSITTIPVVLDGLSGKHILDNVKILENFRISIWNRGCIAECPQLVLIPRQLCSHRELDINVRGGLEILYDPCYTQLNQCRRGLSLLVGLALDRYWKKWKCTMISHAHVDWWHTLTRSTRYRLPYEHDLGSTLWTYY